MNSFDFLIIASSQLLKHVQASDIGTENALPASRHPLPTGQGVRISSLFKMNLTGTSLLLQQVG